jgi:hypothetical protein
VLVVMFGAAGILVLADALGDAPAFAYGPAIVSLILGTWLGNRMATRALARRSPDNAGKPVKAVRRLPEWTLAVVAVGIYLARLGQPAQALAGCALVGLLLGSLGVTIRAILRARPRE